MDVSLGTRVKQLRSAMGMSQADIAYAMRDIDMPVEQSYISKIERGKVELPSHGILDALAKVLMTTPGDLLAAAGFAATPGQDAIPPELVALCQRIRALSERHRRLVVSQVEATLRWLETEEMGAKQIIVEELGPPGIKDAQPKTPTVPPAVTAAIYARR